MKERYAKLNSEQPEGLAKVPHEWTTRSIKRFLNQVTEDIVRFESIRPIDDPVELRERGETALIEALGVDNARRYCELLHNGGSGLGDNHRVQAVDQVPHGEAFIGVTS